MYATQDELEKIKEEMKQIQNQNNELNDKISFKKLIKTVNEVQSKVDVLQQTVTALSNRVSNYDEKFFELNEILRKLNDTILSQHNDILTKQNEIIQVLDMSGNNLEKQTILLIGGYWNNRLLMLENNGQNWKQLNIKLPYEVSNHGAQFLNNYLYIFGGSRSTFTFKLSKSLQWERMTDMHQSRSIVSNSSVTLNDQIWVCGGDYDERSVEMYDPETNEWKQMNESRRYPAAAVVNGKIFCSGGNSEKNDLNSVECYDPSSDVWTRICDMPQKIHGHGAIEMDGNLIIVGGYDGKEFLKNVWALDTTDKSAVWIEKPPMSTPRYVFSIAKIDGRVFICGGSSHGRAIDSVEIFDGEVWKNGPKMPTSRRSAPAVVIPMQFARSLN